MATSKKSPTPTMFEVVDAVPQTQRQGAGRTSTVIAPVLAALNETKAGSVLRLWANDPKITGLDTVDARRVRLTGRISSLRRALEEAEIHNIRVTGVTLYDEQGEATDYGAYAEVH